MIFTATIITCNAALLIGHLLSHLERWFDHIIVIDGPSAPGPGQAGGDGRLLTADKPHSIDGTVDIVRSFIGLDAKKFRLITLDRPWTGKTEKFNAALRYTPPGYIWQNDYDEFYHPSHYWLMRNLLTENSHVTDVEFYARHFWGDTKHHTPIRDGDWGNTPLWRRIFRWTGRERWESHEPPRMFRRAEVLLTAEETRALGVLLHHYSYCVDSQFRQKEIFYGLDGKLMAERRAWQKKRLRKELIYFTGEHPLNLDFLHD